MSILAILSFMSILFISPKTTYFTERLLDEAAKANVAIENFNIQELADRGFEIDINRYDCLYPRFCYPYFEQTIELANKFISAGKKVVDAAIADGDVGLGKMETYEKLMKAGLPVPETRRLSDFPLSTFHFPLILKWTYGFGGKEVFLIKNAADLHRATELIPAEELLLQEFVPAEAEYKIITVGYEALPVVLKFKTDPKNWRPDFGSVSPLSLEGEGRVRGNDNLNKIVEAAEHSSRILNRELAKVDILESQGKFYVLEVNRWPGLKSFEQLTGYNAVKDFLQYLILK